MVLKRDYSNRMSTTALEHSDGCATEDEEPSIFLIFHFGGTDTSFLTWASETENTVF